MKTNWPEKMWVNSPLRALVQRWETCFFQAQSEIPRGGSFLEIGCGRGAAAPLIRSRFRPVRIDALDIDRAMVRLAVRERRRKGGPGLIMEADAQLLPYRDGCMDAVFNFGILHHLENWEMGIREVARVLRPGGRFYFEEIYPPLYANFLFKRLLVHPTANRFHGPQFRSALSSADLRLLPGYRETRFAILGVAVKE